MKTAASFLEGGLKAFEYFVRRKQLDSTLFNLLVATCGLFKPGRINIGVWRAIEFFPQRSK
jgi:hypothetical protein